MHLLVRLPDGVDDGEVARAGARGGTGADGLSALSIAHDGRRGLMLGFTNVREEDAAGLVERLVGVVGR